MSFFDRQGISKALLRRPRRVIHHEVVSSLPGAWPNSDDESDSDAQYSPQDDSHYEDNVVLLQRYSLVTMATSQAGEVVFEMHRLVQLATQEWLTSHKHYERWMRQSI
jgi:hypothetical protein